jgi:acetyltransferase-like isoleucine patch superfamily enzyme
MIGVGCYFLTDQGGSIEIGDNVGINDHCYITSVSHVCIGDDVSIAEFVSVRDFDHGFEGVDEPIRKQPLKASPIRIERGVWIGRGVMITRGVTIGEECVIGANSVVTRDIPPYSVAVGVPARVIRSRRAEGGHQ